MKDLDKLQIKYNNTFNTQFTLQFFGQKQTKS